MENGTNWLSKTSYQPPPLITKNWTLSPRKEHKYFLFSMLDEVWSKIHQITSLLIWKIRSYISTASFLIKTKKVKVPYFLVEWRRRSAWDNALLNSTHNLILIFKEFKLNSDHYEWLYIRSTHCLFENTHIFSLEKCCYLSRKISSHRIYLEQNTGEWKTFFFNLLIQEVD